MARRDVWCVLLAGFCSWPVLATAEPRLERDVEYARVDQHSLLLDLYVPSDRNAPPLIVWVHGGAWRSGSKKDVPIRQLAERGYAIASVDYRLSPVARFPAQAHDIKAAIRYLRARQRDYGFDSSRIIVAGSSAGGHLAALVGVSNGVAALEGSVGEHAQVSSDVQAIVSFYGASNLQSILSQSTPHGLKVRVPALELLLGGQPDAQAELARLASPVAHVDESDPPLLLIHGDQDPQMPINQAHELHAAYKKAGRAVQFEVVPGGVHGGKGFYEPEMLSRVESFLRSQPRPTKAGR
jgi:acetyl esterase/lipase